MPDVLIVEPFDGGSHRAWARGLKRHSAHDVRIVGLPDRFWRWRLRGGAVTLAERIRADIGSFGRPDVVIVSALVDVAGLAGHLRRELGDTPIVVYVHENQLTYPVGPSRSFDPEPAWTNWTSLVVADRVVFNSRFHLDEWFDTVPDFLGTAPDHDHRHLVEAVRERSSVIHPGVEVDSILALAPAPKGRPDRPPILLWNQRWDHDKDPEAWLTAAVQVAADHELEVRLVGERSGEPLERYPWAVEALGDGLVDLGYLERAAYLEALVEADVVVSTAHHEFFGISLVEAMAAGAVPLLPDRLSHPELVGDFGTQVLYSEGDLVDRLSAIVTDIDAARRSVAGLAESMRRFGWAQVAPVYDELVDDVLDASE